MEAGSPVVPVVVAGILQRSCERLVRQPPASGTIVEIVGSILEDHPNRFLRHSSNQCFVVMPAAPEVVACGDVREAASPRDRFAERVRAFPRDGERADAAAALA